MPEPIGGAAVAGAAVVQKFGLQARMHDYIGLVALFGVVFACGLPDWAIVRWLFNFIERRRDKDLGELALRAGYEVRLKAAAGVCR